MTIGFVYVLSNPGMPGLITVGFTTGELEKRLKELRATGVAYPFVLEAAVRVVNPQEVEGRLHREFHDKRVAHDREFFQISPWQVSVRLAQLASEAGYQASATLPIRATGAYDDLADDEESILSILAGRYDGVDVWEIIRYRDHGGETEAMYRISELERKRYIERVRKGHDTYKLADRGIRYLIEVRPPWFSDERG